MCLNMIRSLLLLFFSFCFFDADAQKETNNWFFSNNQGISFNGSTPQQIPGIPMSNVYFGNVTTTCSDQNGNLNFIYSYTNSVVIYNRNYSVMPGSSAILAPANRSTVVWTKQPGSSEKYYIFYTTPSASADSFYLRYALIDMGLNSGLGQVISANNIIDSSMSIAYTIINQKGSDNFWIVSNKSRTKNFYARLVNSVGVTSQPVVSLAGLNAYSTEYFFNTMKASPNGKMFAGAAYTYYDPLFGNYRAFIEVFSFNGQTGIVTNKVRTPRITSSRSLEFSPDSRLLYSLSVDVNPGLQPCGYAASSFSQYNLCYTDSVQFLKFRYPVFSQTFFCTYPVWGNMQLAPDKKIYSRFSGNTISAIRYPNRIGTSCEFVLNQLTSNPASGESLPEFYHHETEKLTLNNINYTGGCHPAPLTFSVTNDTIIQIIWNFGDPASGSQNSSILASPNHSFSAPGIYTVTANLLNTNTQLIETISEVVQIKNPLIRILNGFPSDTSFCQGNGLRLGGSVINGIYQWSYYNPLNPNYIINLGVSDSISIGTTGKYFVTMRQNDCNGCIMTDSINVTVKPVPYVNLGPDQALCANDSIHIGVYDANNNIQCTWNTGQTTDSIWVHTAGTYIVQAEILNNGCPKNDTINISVNQAVLFNLPADTTLCSGQSLLLNPNVSSATYLWQNNSTSPTFNVTFPGLYWVKVTKNGCSKTDSIVVNYISTAQVYLGNDTTLCIGQNLTLSVNIPNAMYQWNTGSSSSSINVSAAGQYWVRVQMNGCTATDTINIFYNPIPYFTLGADTAICENKTIVLSPNILADTYLWQNTSTNSTYTVTNAGLYWLKISKMGCTFSDSINVTYNPSPILSLGNDTVICSGKTLLLNAYNVTISSYLWQNGSVASSYLVAQPGIYYVEATSFNGCKKLDSITISQISTPNFNLGNDTTICEGKYLTLSTPLQSGMNYLWNTGAQSNAIAVNSSGVYWAELNNSGCKKRDSINVFTKISPAVNLGADTTLCNPQELILNAFNNNAGYLWQNGTIQSSYVVKNSGKFYVTVNLNNCFTSDTINVLYKYPPIFSLGEDKKICPGNSLVLDPLINNVNYLWQDGKKEKTYPVTKTGLYFLKVSNECGIYSDSIKIEDGSCNLYIPNSFSPDGNNKNDIFRVDLKENTSSFLLQVYNRFGQLLFQSSDVNKGWDGKFNTIEQGFGAYIWSVKYVLSRDKKAHTYTGTVLLIR